jgi:hypothetical protein
MHRGEEERKNTASCIYNIFEKLSKAYNILWN